MQQRREWPRVVLMPVIAGCHVNVEKSEDGRRVIVIYKKPGFAAGEYQNQYPRNIGNYLAAAGLDRIGMHPAEMRITLEVPHGYRVLHSPPEDAWVQQKDFIFRRFVSSREIHHADPHEAGLSYEDQMRGIRQGKRPADDGAQS